MPMRPETTVLMPFYQRVAPFQQYVRDGFWDGVDLLAVADGAPPAVTGPLRQLADTRPGLTLHAYAENRGVAHARAEAVRAARTDLVTFCDDDDVVPRADRRLAAAAAAFAGADEPPLFVTLPIVHAFNEQLEHRPQYDRRPFHGRTGREVLSWMVQTGELNLLLSGSTFRRADLAALPCDSYFQVSEDYVLLARLCARHPERRVHVLEEGRYWRLIHAGSLAGRYTLEKLLMNLVSMVVGGHHLIEAGDLTADRLAGLLRERGHVLQRSYGMGREAGAVVAALLDGAAPPEGDEARRARAVLDAAAERLPDEFRRRTALVLA